MSRFRRSWALLKCSFRVVFENKKLLLFPIILSLLTIVMAAFFLAPVVLWPTGHGLAEGAHWQAVARQWTVRRAGDRNVVGLSPAGYVLSAALYLLATFLATFVNVLRIIAITAAVWLIGLLAFIYLLNVAGQVYRGALYLYAIEGAAPGPFDAEQMNAAWKIKPGGKPAV